MGVEKLGRKGSGRRRRSLGAAILKTGKRGCQRTLSVREQCPKKGWRVFGGKQKKESAS